MYDQISSSPAIFETYPESGFFGKAILNENAFVRMVAYRLDLNWALIKYPMLFFSQNLKLASKRLRRKVKTKFGPFFNSKFILALQKQIMKINQQKRKIEGYLDKILSKKARLSLITLGFVVAFSGTYIFLQASITKRCSLSSIRKKHKNFLTYAFVDMPKDRYIQGLLMFNALLSVAQLGCCIGSWLGVDPNPHFKHGLNSMSVAGGLALVSQVKILDEKIPKGHFGPLVNTIRKPCANISASTLFGIAYYFSLKGNYTSRIKTISTQVFLNEISLWEQIREAIPSLPQEVQDKIQVAVRTPFMEHVSPKVLEFLKKEIPEETLEFFPLFQDKELYLETKATMYHCLKAPHNICDKLSQEAISFIKDLIKKGLVDGSKFKFGGPQNFYRTPDITGVSMMHLLSSAANVYDDDRFIINLAEVPDNQDLWSWLRMVKFLTENPHL
jgi:hypothetical protein